VRIIRVADVYLKQIDESGDSYDEEDDGFDLYQSLDKADDIFKEVKIRPSRDKKYSYVAFVGEEVVGAIQDSWDTNGDVASFSWDVVVRPDYQNKGVGKKLISAEINKYENEKSIYEEMGYSTRMYIEAINLNLASLLERDFGFEVDVETGDRKYLVRY
jgi:GNAT superfamily N-acetyltransferase